MYFILVVETLKWLLAEDAFVRPPKAENKNEKYSTTIITQN